MSTNLVLSAFDVNNFLIAPTGKALHFRQMDVGERLAGVISSRGIKQSWLALEAGMPEETLSRIVTGRTKNPGVTTLQKIAGALGMTVGELLGEHPPDAISSLDRAKLEEIARELASRAEWLRSRFALSVKDVTSQAVPSVAPSSRPSTTTEERKLDRPADHPLLDVEEEFFEEIDGADTERQIQGGGQGRTKRNGAD